MFLWHHCIIESTHAGTYGALPYHSSEFDLTHVDANVINENFRRLTTLVNGNLSFCNFWRSFSGDATTEYTANRWPESWFALEPRENPNPEGLSEPLSGVAGRYHNHDGVNSSLLGEASVDTLHSILRTPNVCVYRSNTGTAPSSVYDRWCVGMLTFGGIPSQTLTGDPNIFKYHERIFAVPWAAKRWNRASIAVGSDSPSGSGYWIHNDTCVVMSIVCPSANTLSSQSIALLNPHVRVYHDSAPSSLRELGLVQKVGGGVLSLACSHSFLLLSVRREYQA